MKFGKRIIAAACGLAMAGGIALAAPSASAAPAARPAAETYLVRGFISSNGWCLNAPRDLKDGDGVFMAPCSIKNGDQVWLCGRYRGEGFCAPALAKEPLDLGQRGRTNSTLLIDPHHNGSVHYVISFSEVSGSNNWVIGLPSYSRKVALAIPRIRNKGHAYWLHWRTGSALYTYVWHFGGRWYAA